MAVSEGKARKCEGLWRRRSEDAQREATRCGAWTGTAAARRLAGWVGGASRRGRRGIWRREREAEGASQRGLGKVESKLPPLVHRHSCVKSDKDRTVSIKVRKSILGINGGGFEEDASLVMSTKFFQPFDRLSIAFSAI